LKARWIALPLLGVGGLSALLLLTRPAPSECRALPEFAQGRSVGRNVLKDWTNLERLEQRMPTALPSSLTMPIDAPLSRFRPTYARRNWGAIHYGQDFLVPVGTPVRAVADGVLWRVGFQPKGGLELYIVGAGGRRYYYAHLSNLAADTRDGVNVRAGEIIAYSGRTGHAHGVPHLHLGVYTGSKQTCQFKSLDPYPLFASRP
jgi:murein DD-endopeptidase MepM/ murein hydrolase activator NlpD